MGATAHGLRLEGQPCGGDTGQGWEDLLWPPKRSLGLLPGKPSLLLLLLSLPQPCLSPPASHISASELLAPPLLLLLRPLHQTDVNPPCAGSGVQPEMGSRGLRSGGAKGGKSHPETSPFALAWLPSRAFSCLLPPCLPKLEAKASLTPRVIPSFGCLCTDSQPQYVGCITVYLILSFHAGRVFSLHILHCAQLCSPLAPGLTWSGPGHQSQASSRVLRPQVVVRSQQGAGTDQPEQSWASPWGMITDPGYSSEDETRNSSIASRAAVGTQRILNHLCPYTHVLPPTHTHTGALGTPSPRRATPISWLPLPL